MNAVEVHSLDLGFSGHPPILSSLEFEIRKGLKVALVGPNGGGKTTLLKTLAGALSPLAGSIEILGKKPGLSQQSITYLPQSTTFDRSFPITLREFVALGTLPRRNLWRWPSPKQKEKIDGIIRQLDLCEMAEKPISKLSGGQLQRGMLARTLVREAQILLLDEPLSAVDRTNHRLAWEAIEGAVQGGATLLIVTHDSEDIHHCDICFQVDRGTVSQFYQSGDMGDRAS